MNGQGRCVKSEWSSLKESEKDKKTFMDGVNEQRGLLSQTW